MGLPLHDQFRNALLVSFVLIRGRFVELESATGCSAPNGLSLDQNPKLMPKSIFRIPLTVVGWPKNGEVNVPLYPR